MRGRVVAVGRLAAAHRSNDPHGVTARAQRRDSLDAERSERDIASGTEAEHRASSRQLVHRHRGHRGDRGMAEVGVRDADREPQACRLHRGRGEQGERIAARSLVADPQVADADVLAVPGVRDERGR